MENPVCFLSFLNSSKPNRLIFQEKLPEGQKSLPVGQNDRETNEVKRERMEKELYNNVVRPQESESAISGGKMSPEQFMEKYKNLLTTDFEAYGIADGRFFDMGVEKSLKFVEVGYGYLESSNPEIVSEYVTRTLFGLMMQYEQLMENNEDQHPLYKDNPERREKVKKDLLSFINYFVKEKAVKVFENNPTALAYALAYSSERKSMIPGIFEFLTAKVRSFELSDIQTREVVSAVVYTCRGESKEALPYVSRILYESKDKPLSNIVVFKEIIEIAVWGDPKLFLFVLNRGKDIVRDPVAKKYVEEWLAVAEKPENKKVWENFLKELDNPLPNL